MSECFHVNSNFSDQVIFRRRFLNDPNLGQAFLHFCDYLPFEEALAFYLNKVEFPLPKDNLYEV
jgi:hypothetical protein